MFYLTQDQRLENLTKFDQIQFVPSSGPAIKSQIVARGSLGQGTTQVPIDVESDQMLMLGLREVPSKGWFRSTMKKKTETLRNDMTAVSVILDIPAMGRLGLDIIDKVEILASGVYPLKSTPESWYLARGLRKDNEVKEESPENILRKNPIFTVDLIVWAKPFDGHGKPFAIALRNAPIGYVSKLIVDSQAAQYLPGRLSAHLSAEAFKQVVPEGEWTHYMKEEAHRLNQRSGPRKKQT